MVSTFPLALVGEGVASKEEFSMLPAAFTTFSFLRGVLAPLLDEEEEEDSIPSTASWTRPSTSLPEKDWSGLRRE